MKSFANIYVCGRAHCVSTAGLACKCVMEEEAVTRGAARGGGGAAPTELDLTGAAIATAEHGNVAPAISLPKQVMISPRLPHPCISFCPPSYSRHATPSFDLLLTAKTGVGFALCDGYGRLASEDCVLQPRPVRRWKAAFPQVRDVKNGAVFEVHRAETSASGCRGGEGCREGDWRRCFQVGSSPHKKSS